MRGHGPSMEAIGVSSYWWVSMELADVLEKWYPIAFMWCRSCQTYG